MVNSTEIGVGSMKNAVESSARGREIVTASSAYSVEKARRTNACAASI